MNGIGIREFQKLLYPVFEDEKSRRQFLKACENYKSRIKNDNEAKAFAKISNLNAYKVFPFEFIEQVGVALEFIENRKRGRAFRKGKKLNGVEVLYEDENCFVVSPKDYRHSRKAAYLDNGSANWCIASPPKRARKFWNSYSANSVFYIYSKKGNSWAAVLDAIDLDRMRRGQPTTLTTNLSFIETRANNTFGKVELMQDVQTKMLAETGLDEDAFKGIVKKGIRKRRYDYFNLAYNALLKKEYEVFFKCLKKTNCFEKVSEVDGFLRKGILHMAVRSGNLKSVKALYENSSKIIYGVDGKLLNVLPYAMNRDSHQVFEYLLEQGMDINERDKYGDMLCFKPLPLDELLYYEKRGLDIHAVAKGYNLAYYCYEDGCLETLKYLENKGIHLKDCGDANLSWLLTDLGDVEHILYGTQPKSLEILEYILKDLKIDPNNTAIDYTPLHRLCMKADHSWRLTLGRGNSEVQNEQLKKCMEHTLKTAKIFLENGADIFSTRAFYEQTPLLAAIENNAYSLVELLLKYNRNNVKEFKIEKKSLEQLTEKMKGILKKYGVEPVGVETLRKETA